MKNFTTGKNVTIYHEELSVICDGASIGDNCKIHANVWIGENVVIGNNCLIQAFAFIPSGVDLGNNVFIGPHVVFTNDKKPPSFGKYFAPIRVCDGASIGANATILPGVTIGPYAVIGAGAVVTKDVPGSQTWVGNPARKLEK